MKIATKFPAIDLVIRLAYTSPEKTIRLTFTLPEKTIN